MTHPSNMIPSHKSIVRFILVAVFVSLFVLCLGDIMSMVEFGIFHLPDTDLPPYPKPTILQQVDDTILFIAMLPSSACGFICAKLGIIMPKSLAVFLLITPGLFWASVFELVFRVWKRRVA
jgi:hypothetical protein